MLTIAKRCLPSPSIAVHGGLISSTLECMIAYIPAVRLAKVSRRLFVALPSESED